jgi:hypothetical protein
MAGEDFNFYLPNPVSKGGALPCDNLKFIGTLRNRFVENSGNENKEPKPPSFYQQDFEAFLKKKRANKPNKEPSVSTSRKLKLNENIQRQDFSKVRFPFKVNFSIDLPSAQK